MRLDLKECFILMFIIILLLIITNSNAEVITWKFGDNPTVEKCMKESKQSEKICKKIIYLIDKSQKYDKLYIGGIFDEE